VICHEMLHKNGGTIAAKSEPDKGSSFTFTLPVAIRHDTSADTEEHHVEDTPMDVANALIASAVVLNEEAQTAFKKFVVPPFEEVSRVLSIENLERFSKILTNTGEKFNLVALTNFGKSLATLTLGHQIDQIIKILPRFSEYLDKIMSQS